MRYSPRVFAASSASSVKKLAVASGGGAARADYGNSDGVVHAHEDAGLRRKLNILGLAGNDIGRAASQADAKAAHDVAEEQADHRSASGADRGREDVTFIVVFFLQDPALLDLHIFARLFVGLARLLDGDDAHLHGYQAAVHFE